MNGVHVSCSLGKNRKVDSDFPTPLDSPGRGASGGLHAVIDTFELGQCEASPLKSLILATVGIVNPSHDDQPQFRSAVPTLLVQNVPLERSEERL